MTKYLKFNTPAIDHAAEFKSDYGLENHSIREPERVFWNLTVPALYEEAIFRGEGKMVNGGPLLVTTGKHTARAANDKYVVREPGTEHDIWWGEYNRPYDPDKFSALYSRLMAFLQGEELFVQDTHAGADEENKLAVRVITDSAWQSMFARNMLIPVEGRDNMRKFVPDFTVIAAPGFNADPIIDGTRTGTAIILNFSQRVAIICGTKYAGEIKKSVFTVMNYLLPKKNVMAMHCSANVGDKDDVALFFGLSGTGKTTLSADPKRHLIGDDEHGWSSDGVFNFEGGCYAKVIRLSQEAEPEIYACTHKFGTILENVVHDRPTRKIDLDDDHFTENSRASYPLDFIPNVMPNKRADAQPKNVIFLTCDASGVMPPISKLNLDQAQYHFISGYTSKIAGTEIGLGVEPKLTFSACFGAPFMVHHPFVYARLLQEKMAAAGAHCWLVNTGWVGGDFWTGKRISIRHTRNMLNAVLDGKLEKVTFRTDKLFGFEVPTKCPDVPDDVLDPANAWSDKDLYWNRYDALASRYIENFKLFAEGCSEEVKNAGPKRK